MVDEHEIVERARITAETVLREAEARAQRIREGADAYAAQVLVDLDNRLSTALGSVKKGIDSAHRRAHRRRDRRSAGTGRRNRSPMPQRNRNAPPSTRKPNRSKPKPPSSNPSNHLRAASSSYLAAVWIVAAALFATAPASADVAPAVTNAIVLMSKLPSYHMSMTTPEGPAETDVVNPGKMHTVMKAGEMYVIGPTMYMKIGGKWTKFANSNSGTDVLARYHKFASNYSSQDLGMRTIQAGTFHAYAVHDTAHPDVKNTIYLDGSGRIVRIDINDNVVIFSRFGVPVSIQPPM